MKTKILLLLFTFLLISCQRSYDKQAEEVDFFKDSDFPTEEMLVFLCVDLEEQTKQDYFNFVFEDEPLNEQQKILFLGAWASDIFERYQLNLYEEKFVFVDPPHRWTNSKPNNNFPTVFVPRIVTTENKNLFFAELRVEGRERKYIFLALKNEKNEWVRFLTGNVMTDEEMDEITIKI